MRRPICTGIKEEGGGGGAVGDEVAVARVVDEVADISVRVRNGGKGGG